MIAFLGTGSAFSKENGNTSAYIKIDSDSLLLIDCGESVFNTIINFDILDNIKNIYILITHFHSDHIGSLGSLLFYCDYLGIQNISILFPNKTKLMELISIFGLNPESFIIKKPDEVTKFKIKEFKQKHSDMESYGYLIRINDIEFFYSGDTKTIPQEIIDNLDKIDFIYQDVRENNYPHHLSIQELDNLIPERYHSKIYCMHYPDDTDLSKIKEKGFNVVERKRIK